MATKNQKISAFKSNIVDKSGLARANLFQVDLDFPDAVKSATSFKSNTGGEYTVDSVKDNKFSNDETFIYC